MDYANELKELLRPLGIYDVSEGAGAAELDAVGAQLTDVWDFLEQAERESTPMTAEGDGLAAWERLLPFAPAWLTAAVGLAEAVIGAGLSGYLSLCKSDHKEGGITFEAAKSKNFIEQTDSPPI